MLPDLAELPIIKSSINWYTPVSCPPELDREKCPHDPQAAQFCFPFCLLSVI